MSNLEGSGRVGARLAMVGASVGGQTAGVLWLPICVFVLISGADTISTLALLQAGMMVEFNPLMNLVLRHWGLTGFALVKLLLILIPASVFVHVGVQRPALVRSVVWALNGLYLLLYVVLFSVVNA